MTITLVYLISSKFKHNSPSCSLWPHLPPPRQSATSCFNRQRQDAGHSIRMRHGAVVTHAQLPSLIINTKQCELCVLLPVLGALVDLPSPQTSACWNMYGTNTTIIIYVCNLKTCSRVSQRFRIHTEVVTQLFPLSKSYKRLLPASRKLVEAVSKLNGSEQLQRKKTRGMRKQREGAREILLVSWQLDSLD